MNNIIEKYCNEYSNNLAEEIDNCFVDFFKVPDWITKRLWIYKIYSKLSGFKIVHHLNSMGGINYIEFFKRNKKVGTMKINHKIKIEK